MTDALAGPVLPSLVTPLGRLADAAERAEPGALTDLATLGAALQREAPVLLAAARAITLDDAEAADLVQTTFELAVRHRAALRDPAALRPWLLRIQTREAFRVVRRLRRVVRFDPAVSELRVGPADLDGLAIRDALRGLPPRVRAAVVLHHLIGLSVAETADAMAVSTNTVKSQLRDGLARLRQELGDD